jgi:tetratricopeptide (TPR) repeat protein
LEEEEAPADPLAGLPLMDDSSVAAPTKHRSDDDYVNLADWLAEGDAEKSTRMVASDDRRAVEGQAAFEDMLEKFKEGVAANVDEGDAESHYDLGVAYREMGLLDEAISEFQTALRGTTQRIRTYEALGQCFIDKHVADVAANVLAKALEEDGATDEQLVGVLYLLGIASETLGHQDEASAYFQRIVAVDIDFRDAGKRIGAGGRGSR